MDNEASYEVIGKYQGQNERHANVAIQINASLCTEKCLGTKTADLYEGLTTNGSRTAVRPLGSCQRIIFVSVIVGNLKTIDFNDKNIEECLISAKSGFIGTVDEPGAGNLTVYDDDMTPCISWNTRFW